MKRRRQKPKQVQRPKGRVQRKSKFLPFYRNQLRWALSCHRRALGVGTPALYENIRDAFPEKSLLELLSHQDLVNFLNGVESFDYKVEIFEEFIRRKAPEYFATLTHDGLIESFTNILHRVFFSPLPRKLYEEKSTGAAQAMDRMTYCWYNMHGQGFPLVQLQLFHFKRIAATPYIQTIYAEANTQIAVPRSMLDTYVPDAEERAEGQQVRFKLRLRPLSKNRELEKQCREVDASKVVFNNIFNGVSFWYDIEKFPFTPNGSWITFMKSFKHPDNFYFFEIWPFYRDIVEIALATSVRGSQRKFVAFGSPDDGRWSRVDLPNFEVEFAKIGWLV